MAERHDLHVRAHTVQLIGKERGASQNTNIPKWPDFALIFDCESRLSPDQSLTFGFWRFCELRNGEYVVVEEGIFHADRVLNAREFDALREYAKTRKPETTSDGCSRVQLYSRSKFVHEVLGMAIQARALIVGLNLCFDLGRCALDWETAENGGWSLILSQWCNPKTGTLEENKFFPRIVVKSLNSKTAIIQSMQPRRSRAKEKQ